MYATSLQISGSKFIRDSFRNRFQRHVFSCFVDLSTEQTECAVWPPAGDRTHSVNLLEWSAENFSLPFTIHFNLKRRTAGRWYSGSSKVRLSLSSPLHKTRWIRLHKTNIIRQLDLIFRTIRPRLPDRSRLYSLFCILFFSDDFGEFSRWFTGDARRVCPRTRASRG